MNYIEIAREGKNDWWRYLLGYPFILFTWLMVGSIPVFIMAGIVMFDNNPATNLLSTGFVGINPVLNFIVNMLTFIPFILATILTVIVLHRRHARTLVTPGERINWKRLFTGFGVWAIISAGVALVEALTHPGRYQFTPHPESYLPFAIASIILVPIQTSSEELFFRGYLIQNIGLKIKQPLVLSFISGLIFTLPHLANPEVAENALLVPLFYFFFGAFATFVSLRDNGLELPLGMHAGNNLFTALFVNATVTALPTPAIFTVTEFDVVYNLVSPLVGMAVFYVLMFKVWPKKVETNISTES
jgi:membrane protease YdiL (CAAX protease family)